jgi:hypothetical protein
MTRTGMQRLGKMRMRTVRLGTGDDDENKIIFANIQDVV